MIAPAPDLLVTADDFGLCDDVNVATIAAFDAGLVRSVEIMPTAPDFEAAVALALTRPALDVGVHLTLTSEFDARRWRPLLEKQAVATLVDVDGCFYRDCDSVAARASLEEVERELTAQVLRVIAAGLKPSHLSQHMFVLDDWSPQGQEAERLLGALHARFGLAARVTNQPAAERLALAGMPVVARVPTDTHDVAMAERPARYAEIIAAAGAGRSSLELIVHCGFDTEAMGTFTAFGPRRQQDFELVTGLQLRQQVAAAGLRLGSWRDILAAQRDANPA